jgi:hypothetical protein
MMIKTLMLAMAAIIGIGMAIPSSASAASGSLLERPVCGADLQASGRADLGARLPKCPLARRKSASGF